MAKLGEVCTIVSGSTPKTSVTSYWDGNIKWITPAELNEDTFYIMDSVRHITEEGKEKTGLSYLPTGTVILSSRAPIGKTAIAGCKMCCNQGFKNLICSDAIYNEYLYFFLKSKTDYLNSLGRGATFKEISKSIVENIEIPLPEVNQQKEIAEKFKKLEQLIPLRKQQLAKLDELVKARFVEMFGDPVVNSKRWPVETIENHIDLLTGFPFDSSGYVSKGVNICGGLIIMPQKIDWSACKHWPQITGYEDYILRPNDIVIALDRPWISNGFKIAMVDREHLPALLIQRTARIRAVDINQHYLMQSLLLGRFDKHCNITGSLVPYISPKDIKSYSVMIPPIELQNQFAAFVERVDQQKQTVQQSLEKLELMKKALMQEYFG